MRGMSYYYGIRTSIHIYIYTAPARICTPLIVSRSLRSLANYRPFPLAQKPSNGVLASGDPITPSNTVKYHPSSNTLISTEQRGGVLYWRASEASETLSGVTQSRFRYIYLFIYLYGTYDLFFRPRFKLRLGKVFLEILLT